MEICCKFIKMWWDVIEITLTSILCVVLPKTIAKNLPLYRKPLCAVNFPVDFPSLETRRPKPVQA